MSWHEFFFKKIVLFPWFLKYFIVNDCLPIWFIEHRIYAYLIIYMNYHLINKITLKKSDLCEHLKMYEKFKQNKKQSFHSFSLVKSFHKNSNSLKWNTGAKYQGGRNMTIRSKQKTRFSCNIEDTFIFFKKSFQTQYKL